MWMEEDGHSTHDGDYCHDTSSHQNTNHTTEADCEAAGHMWMEFGHHDEEMTPERASEQHDNDSHIHGMNSGAGWNEEHHHGHEGHHEEHHNVAVLYPGNSMEMYEAEHDALPENATGWNLDSRSWLEMETSVSTTRFTQHTAPASLALTEPMHLLTILVVATYALEYNIITSLHGSQVNTELTP